MASACSSSGATTAPGGSGGSGGSGGPGGSTTPVTADSVITGFASGSTQIKSFHIKLTAAGTIKKSALNSGSSSASPAIAADFKLDGATLEGDVDIANQAAHLTGTLPAVPISAAQSVSMTGEVILVDKSLYYKYDVGGLTSNKFAKIPLGDLTGALPIPTTAATATMNLTDEIAKLRTSMQAAGVTTTLVGVEKIGGVDAYHISVGLPIAKINTLIAADATGTAMTVDSASVDVWIYKSNSRLAQLEMKGASAQVGNIDITLTVSNYDQQVTITAPAASDVAP
jgi:hypothetical protein